MLSILNSKNRQKYFIWFITITFFFVITWLVAKSIRTSPASHDLINVNNLINKENIIPIAIVGSGPAGLMAAVYGARAKIKTVVIEGNKPGGLLTETSWVENWPGNISILGNDIIENLKKQASYFGAQFLSDSVEQVDFNQWPFVLYTENGKKLHALSVIIATGATPRLLGVPGEEKYWGTGVTSCAVCDAPFFQDEEVVVVGGGDSAVEEAIQLAPYAKKITILVRKSSMRAAARMQERLAAYEKINVRYNIEVQKIIGEESQVTGVELLDNKTKEVTIMPTSGVFLAIGHDPNSGLLSDSIALNSAGYIQLPSRSQETTKSGIFAAGDVADWEYRQAGVAAGDGIKAVLDAIAFLNKIGFNTVIANKIKQNMFNEELLQATISVDQVSSISAFNHVITKNSGLVVVDFYADYCPSCLRMLPVIDAVAQQFAGEITFVKVDAEAAKELVEELFVYKVPCLFVFQNGQLIARYNEVMTKKELTLLLQQLVNSEENL